MCFEFHFQILFFSEISTAEFEKLKSDSEEEELDWGNDPDNVGGSDGAAPPDLAPDIEPVKHEGSIKSLIDSTSDLELNSVSLTPTQVKLQ